MVLVPEYTLQRLQQQQKILTPPVTQTLRNLDVEMSEILSNKHLDDEEKAKLYNQAQRYLTFYDQRKAQPHHVKLTSSKAEETPLQQEKSDTLTESLPTETSEDTAIEEEVMRSVPKVYKTEARQLLDTFKDNRDVLHWNNKGELLYEDKAISGSRLVDLVNDILRHRKGFEPVGWSVFARGQSINQSINFI